MSSLIKTGFLNTQQGGYVRITSLLLLLIIIIINQISMCFSG